ncbi:MAG: ABC transporter permease [Thermomicrobiales bacterium]|nr:ABC transporter permease [Thermomicrobiales bacterium]
MWEAVVRVLAVPNWLLPPPSAVAIALVEDRALLLANARVTLAEVLTGFALALVVGLALAIAIDSSPTLDRALYPLVVASQTVPIPAIAPLLLIWFGYGLLPKVLVTALVGFFPIAVNAVDGLRSADRETLAMLRAFGADRRQQFRLVRMPSALPAIFSGARIAIAVCVIGAVFGELVGSNAGLGYLMIRAIAQFRTERVIAAIVLLSLMGVGLFLAVSLVERWAIPWRRYLVADRGRPG